MSMAPPQPATTAPSLDALRRCCSRYGGELADADLAAERARGILAQRSDDRSWAARRACRTAVSALLVELARSADGRAAQARARLTRIWAPDVLRWCRWLCNPRLEADDIAQDVLLVMAAELGALRDPRSFEAWLRNIAWRRVRDEQRRAWLRLRLPMPTREPRARQDGPLRSLALSERARLVRRILHQMSLERRQLLWLAYVEGLRRAEICAQLGLSLGSLNRKMTRARADFERRARRLGLEEGAIDIEHPGPDEGGRRIP